MPIKTRLKYQFSGHTIETRLNDSVFSALRGPDLETQSIFHGAKRWGAAIVRSYLADYKYGSTCSVHSIFARLRDQMPTLNYNYFEREVAQLLESGSHYAGHMYQAFRSLLDAVEFSGDTQRERFEITFLSLMKDLWNEITGATHKISYGDDYTFSLYKKRVRETLTKILLYIMCRYPDTQ